MDVQKLAVPPNVDFMISNMKNTRYVTGMLTLTTMSYITCGSLVY
jgi:hypothetical protein